MTPPAQTRKRIAERFARLKAENRAALVTFVTAGDPDYSVSSAILKALPEAGADLIEIGMPFSDPMAEGPPIQASSLRALKAGQTMEKTLSLTQSLRRTHPDTPVVLMGYLNPILSYGSERFAQDAAEAGVDGLIVVDCPPEEDDAIGPPLRNAGLDMIRLATPTTDAARLPRVLDGASGFLYYVSILGITGTAAPDAAKVETAVAALKRTTTLPVAVGFGVRTDAQAEAIGRFADGVVVGSALVTSFARAATSSAASRVWSKSFHRAFAAGEPETPHRKRSKDWSP